MPDSPSFLPAALRMGFHTGLASALFATGFQPFVSLALTGKIHAAVSTSLLLFAWKIYLLDRLKANPEDENESDGNAAAFARRHRPRLWALFAALAVAQVPLVVMNPGLLASIAIGLAASLLYLVRLPVVCKRVKEVPYLKCFYLSATSLIIVAAFTPGFQRAGGQRFAVAGICGLLYFLNFSLYDLKDLDGDAKAGMKTLAGLFPVRVFLGGHGLLALAGLVVGALALHGGFRWVVAGVCVFHAGASWWLARHPFNGAVCGAIDTGYGLILGLGALSLAP
jgi:hypothetical protein